MSEHSDRPTAPAPAEHDADRHPADPRLADPRPAGPRLADPRPAGPRLADPHRADRHDADRDAPAADAPPATQDLVIDAAARELAAVDASDLDGTLAAGDNVHRTLQARLSDLGG